MAQLAIKGHATRGREVIELLEMLGGKNIHNSWGVFGHRIYTIDEKTDEIIDVSERHYSVYHLFTLEEFLEKFPYKVGDKVYNIIHNENQTITNLVWHENEVVYQTNNNEYVYVNYLQPYKEVIMKLHVCRDKYGWLTLHESHPFNNSGMWFSDNGTTHPYIRISKDLFPEVTFENSPQEMEIKIPTTKPLTRDYFSNHNWEIVIHEPDENGFILWEAKWKRSMEEGSPYYSDLTVTNMMYEDRFCISGKTSKGNVGYLMAYTEEDLINILKVFAIYSFYEQESKKLNLN